MAGAWRMTDNVGATPSSEERSRLKISTVSDADGFMRLVLVGEFDLSTVDEFTARIRQLRHEVDRIRLDLFQVAFMDSAALGVLVTAVENARMTDWTLQVDGSVAPQVRRVVELTRTDSVLWPQERQ